MRGANLREDEALLTAARREPAAFTAFYRRFERPVLGFFLRATGRPDLAADLTAETFARALESIDNYDPARGRADQWLFGIARNVLGTSYRRGRVDAAARERLGLPTLILDDHALEAITRLSAAEGEATLALAQLPEDQKQAIEAHVLDERDYAEIAKDLQCSEAVVRQRVSRGLRALRTRLAGEPDEHPPAA
jgi:RNA polymerase sigma-70 factor (ECF subfamily)